LGEKLFMRWLRDRMKAGKLEPIDVMNATLPQMDAWVKKNVDPMEAKIASNGPELGLLAGQGQGAMNEYIGLNLWMDTILPPNVFARAIRDSGSIEASEYAAGMMRTIETWPSGVVVAIPASYKKTGAWIPVGKCRVAGATVMKRKGDWALVQPGVGAVTLVPPKL
jgi:hypothetical protein